MPDKEPVFRQVTLTHRCVSVLGDKASSQAKGISVWAEKELLCISDLLLLFLDKPSGDTVIYILLNGLRNRRNKRWIGLVFVLRDGIEQKLIHSLCLSQRKLSTEDVRTI